MTQPPTKGGNRPNAGRKPAIYGVTKMLRVPVGCLAEVILLIKKYKDKCMKEMP